METLSPELIADAVNRSGFGNTNRSRRELMRLGESDPDAFQEKYKDFLQPTQPSSPYIQQPSTWDFNYTNPTDGWTIKDLGKGQYDIYNPSGSSVGKGYKSLHDTITELQADYTKNYDPKNYFGFITNDSEAVDPYTQLVTQFETDPRGMPKEYNPSFTEAGALSEWEVLGNLLNGQGISGYSDKRSFPFNGNNETIKGLQTLYGSKPVMSGDTLSGYSMDLNPAKPTDYGYINPQAVQKLDNKGSTRSNASLHREYLNPESWSNTIQRQDNGNYFVDKDKASDLPGWINEGDYKYQHKSNNLLGSIAPLLVSLVPGLQPLGAALGGLSSMANTGTGFGALGAGLGLSGMFNGLGDVLGVSNKLGSAIGQSGLNAGFNLLQNKPVSPYSLLSNIAGSSLGEYYDSDALGKGAQIGLNSLFNFRGR